MTLLRFRIALPYGFPSTKRKNASREIEVEKVIGKKKPMEKIKLYAGTSEYLTLRR